MRILNNKEEALVSGGSLTQDILNLFRPRPTEQGTWENPSTIETPSHGKGSDFGKLFVGIFAAAAAVVGVFGTVVAGSLVSVSNSDN
jgi:hypothetical protein